MSVNPVRYSKINTWGPVLVCAGGIFVLSSMPGKVIPPLALFPHQDKVLHLILYTPLALSLLRAIERSVSGSFLLHCVMTVAGTTLYGVSDEIHQWFVPRRSADPWDVLADGTGALLACGLWWLLKRRRSAANRGALGK
jgi:VanZ family protein